MQDYILQYQCGVVVDKPGIMIVLPPLRWSTLGNPSADANVHCTSNAPSMNTILMVLFDFGACDSECDYSSYCEQYAKMHLE